MFKYFPSILIFKITISEPIGNYIVEIRVL